METVNVCQSVKILIHSCWRQSHACSEVKPVVNVMYKGQAHACKHVKSDIKPLVCWKLESPLLEARARMSIGECVIKTRS